MTSAGVTKRRQREDRKIRDVDRDTAKARRKMSNKVNMSINPSVSTRAH